MTHGYRTRLEGQAVDFVAGLSGTVYPPERRLGARGLTQWVVRAVDVLGEEAEKVFSSKDRALDFYTSVWMGQTAAEAAVKADPNLPGRRETSMRTDQIQLHEMVASGSQATHQASKKSRKGINFRKVAEVLEDYGLDPAETVAEVLQTVTVVDPETGVEREEHRLEAGARAQIALELLQYTRPKLKAVEMKVEGQLSDLTQDQIDQRVKRLIAGAIAQEGGA